MLPKASQFLDFSKKLEKLWLGWLVSHNGKTWLFLSCMSEDSEAENSPVVARMPTALSEVSGQLTGQPCQPSACLPAARGRLEEQVWPPWSQSCPPPCQTEGSCWEGRMLTWTRVWMGVSFTLDWPLKCQTQEWQQSSEMMWGSGWGRGVPSEWHGGDNTAGFLLSPT